MNSSPAMDYSTEVTLPLVKKCMEDVPKVPASSTLSRRVVESSTFGWVSA